MKKILFVSDSFRIGGIQKSLKTLLQYLDYNKYEIYLYLFNDNYPKDLPKGVHTMKSNYLLRTIALTRKEAKGKGVFTYIIRMILAGMCKIFNANFVYSLIFLFTKNIGPYETAISFSNNGDPHSVYYGYNSFVLKKVKANKKVTFLHVNYEQMHMNNRYNRKEYPQFDKIVCVSKDTKQTFLRYFPNLKQKAIIIYNFLPVAKINERITNPYFGHEFIMVSAGRLDTNKNPLLQIEIANELKEEFSFKWYFLGDGPDRILLERYIKNNHLKNCVFLVGNRDDAYRYIKYADIYISTSKSESYGLSIAESLYLNTPVLALDYPALREIITDKYMICKDKQDMKTKLIFLLKNRKELKKMKDRIFFQYNEENIIKKLESLF